MALVPIGQDQVVEVKEPTRDMFPSTLGGAVEFTIVHFVYKVLEVMGEGIGIWGGSILVGFLDRLEPELVDYLAPLLDEILQVPELPDSFRQFIEQLRHPESFAGAAILGQLGGVAGGTIVGSLVGALLSPATYAINSWLRPARTDPASSYGLFWRGLIDDGTLRDWLSDQGWPDIAITGFEEVLRPRLAIGDMIALAWRGEVDMSSVKAELVRRGYTSPEADDLLKVAERIPGPGDLISMAVREAFHPELVAKYGYMQNFPPEFADWMEKQGFDRHWAEKYWTAHWRLPSIQQAFTMLHRGFIGMDEIRDLLRTADVAPTWHDPIIEVAYSTYTRVDVRRMHKMGILSDAELVRSYMDLGYDEVRALNMAEFTIMYNTETERDATKADILKGYRLGMFKRDRTIELLVDIGVVAEWAEYFVDMEDIRIEEQRIDEEIKTVKVLFVNGEITESEVHARLGVLGLAGDRVARLLEEWHILRERKITRPTRGDLERFYRQGQIDEGKLAVELGKRGYIPEYIGLYQTDLLIRMMEEARLEEEWAREEADRVRTREVKTTYDVIRAEFDVEIAEFRVSKAEDKLLLMTTIDFDVIDALEVHVKELDVQIANRQREKAASKVAYLEE